MTPGVSVLIPTKDRAGFLDNAIRSVLAQTHRPLEILISDNHSSDETPSLIEGYLARPVDGITIRAFCQEEDIGPVANHLFLLEKATNRYCSFLHDDDLFLERDFLSGAVRTLAATPRCFACVGNAVIQEVDMVSGETVAKDAMLALPHCDTLGWEVRDGTSFALSLGGKVGWPSYSAIIFDRIATASAGAFKAPFLIGAVEGKKYALPQEEGMCFLFLLALGNNVGYTNQCVVARTLHAGQSIRQPDYTNRASLAIVVLHSNLCMFLIRGHRAPIAQLLRWFISRVVLSYKLSFARHTIATLLKLTPETALLHFAIQILRAGYARIVKRGTVGRLGRPVYRKLRARM